MQTATVTITAATLIQNNAVKSIGDDNMDLHQTFCALLTSSFPSLFSQQSHSAINSHTPWLNNTSASCTIPSCSYYLTVPSLLHIAHIQWRWRVHPFIHTSTPTDHIISLFSILYMCSTYSSTLVINSTYLFLCTSTATSPCFYFHFHLHHHFHHAMISFKNNTACHTQTHCEPDWPREWQQVKSKRRGQGRRGGKMKREEEYASHEIRSERSSFSLAELWEYPSVRGILLGAWCAQLCGTCSASCQLPVSPSPALVMVIIDSGERRMIVKIQLG